MSRIIQVEDKLVVGGAESGHELVASLVGQYLSKAYEVSGSSLSIAASGIDLGWNSLIPSTLSTGYSSETDELQSWVRIEELYKGFSDKVIYVKRDLKDDVGIQISKIRQEGEEITTDKIDHIIRGIQLCKERLDTLGTSYTTISFEHLVEAPHLVLAKVLHKLRPEVDIIDIKMSVIDDVVAESEVRGLREEAESPYAEKVGAWADTLTIDQARYIDQRAKELGL